MESQAAVAAAMEKKAALDLINGLVTADEKWLAFDKFVDAQVNKAEKIRRITVIKGLILESTGREVKDYRNKTIKAVMRDLSGDDQRRVHKKFLSIKSLISQARNNEAAKSKGAEKKKRSTMTVTLPNNTRVDLNTYEGFKSLMEYRLAGLSLSQLSEIEGIVKEAINNSDKTKKLKTFKKMDKEVNANAAH